MRHLFNRRNSLLLAASVGVASFFAVLSAVGAITHGSLVPDQPRNDLPEVLDGIVWDSAQIGHRVIVAGDFTQVKLGNGSTVTQPGLFAYDIDTGEFDATFDPVITGGGVNAIDVWPDGQSFVIGGTFVQVDGRFRDRIAKLDVDGEVDTQFVASANSKVNDVVIGQNRVFLGGVFTAVNGVARQHLAAVDSATGALDSTFDFPLTMPVGGANSGSARALDMTPDRSKLFVAHTSLLVGGQNRAGVARFDVGGGASTLSTWQTNLYRDNYTHCHNSELSLRDLEVSPDGSYLVIVGKGDDRPPVCDTAVAFPVAGGTNVQELWVTRMFDSTYSVGISDFAVYVGGHFCFTEGANAPGAPGYGSNLYPFKNGALKPQQCNIDTNTDQLPYVARYQIAALDPATGWALDWNPKSNAIEAVYSLEVIDRGLLLGHDRDRVKQILVGRHAMFDLGELPDAIPPTPEITFPSTDGAALGAPVELAGTATDNYRVKSITVRLLNETTGDYLQDDGSIGPGANTQPAAMSPSSMNVDWTLQVNNLTIGSYRLDVKATDWHDNVTPTWTRRFFTVPSALSCNGLAVSVDIGAGQTPTNGADVILGTGGADTINGLGGDDTICGLGGNDTINGGNGSDTIFGGSGDDVLGGQGGADLIYGEGNNDLINGGVGNDQAWGGPGNDDLRGQGNNDTLWGEAGVDQFYGGSGNDTIHTGSGGNLGTAQVVRGQGNNDTIWGSSANDILDGGPGLDEIHGQGGDDVLNGGNASDTLFGDGGSDTLNGDASGDVLYGGTGNDDLNGGGGNDALDGQAGTDSCDGGPDSDTATATCETLLGIP